MQFICVVPHIESLTRMCDPNICAQVNHGDRYAVHTIYFELSLSGVRDVNCEMQYSTITRLLCTENVFEYTS